MIKKQSRIIALVLIFVICFSTVSFAADKSTKSSLYLTCYSAYIWPEGDGDISIWFDVTGTGTMDEIGALTIILQQSSNGSTWSTVKTYRYTSYLNMLGYNAVYYTSGVDYSGTEDYYYRAYVTVWAGEDGDGDSRQILTATVRAQ
ncbi:MAG: hypothetical protein EOM54_00115 [Clostridia bacterium]|nr:hypothetical protein [Clostridia bacterium]